MTDEQFANRMNFIVEQQVKFSSEIQARREFQARTDGMLRNLVEINLSLTGHVQEIDARLKDFITGTEDGFRTLDEKFDSIADFQAHSGQRLGALINGVN